MVGASPHRALRNKTVEAWEAAGRPRSGERPGEGEIVAAAAAGDVVRYRSMTVSADVCGDIDALSLWAGQSVGLVSSIKPAAEIMNEVISEAEAILRALTARVEH
jgi:NAD(P)H-dependent flavin oxidoreductase YrpB (nitropropane dioxygenase family)